VPDPARMMAEISRVLAPEGVCYFAATNRLCVIEQHYHLPFLSIIPVSWANYYLRWCGRGQYYHERHMTLLGLRRLTVGLTIDDYTLRLLANPARYHADYMIKSRGKMIFARILLRFAYWAFPGYVWVLRK